MGNLIPPSLDMNLYLQSNLLCNAVKKFSVGKKISGSHLNGMSEKKVGDCKHFHAQFRALEQKSVKIQIN